MDYKEKYEDALDLARTYHRGCIIQGDNGGAEILEDIFSELKEGEDERIRKELIEHIKANYEADYILFEKFSPDDVIAWLEKQGEKKSQGKSALEAINEVKVNNSNSTNGVPFDYENANIQQKDFAPKQEPKFQNGQWIVWLNQCYKVNYNGCGYELLLQNGLCTSLDYGTVDKSAHLWTIQDAKDGDVLVDSYSKDSIIILYKGINKEQSILAHCGWNGYNFSIKTNGLGYGGLDNTNYLPATKEQRDLLFQKMHEAGYEWDVDKKELKKLSNEDDKDLTMGGFVEKKFDELQEELDAIKKRIVELEEKRGETPHPYPVSPDNFPCDGTTCTNPFQDCINCQRRFGEGQKRWYPTVTTNLSNIKKSYFPEPSKIDSKYCCDGIHCYSPQMDCVDCPRRDKYNLNNIKIEL